jgi:hypothetical protein
MNGLDDVIELGVTPWRGYATVREEGVDAGFVLLMINNDSSVM